MRDDEWDAIVIGAGVGGMTAAAYLAALGKRTLLLEQYTVLGGCSHVFRREKKWEFDVGVHYLGDCGPTGQIPTLLRGLGLEDRITFAPLDPDGFDTLCFPDARLSVPVGWDRYLERLCAAFPDEKLRLERFVGTLVAISAGLDRSQTPGGLPSIWKLVRGAKLDARWALRPLSSLLDACQLSPRARAALTVHSGTYMCPPSRAPVALHAGYLHNFIAGGAYYPRGGGQVFAAQLADVVRTHGGSIRTSASVSRILVEAKRVRGVELANGERLHAPVVVSAADLKRTFLSLVGREHLSKKQAERVAGYRMTAPFFNAYLGLDIDLRGTLPSSNLFAMPSWDDADSVARDLIDLEGGPLRRESWLQQADQRLGALVHCAEIKDPERVRSTGACSALEVMTAVPGDAAFWGVAGGGHSYRDSAAYLDLKEQLTEIMVRRAEQVLPGIRRHIVWREAGTPFTQTRYTRASGGSAYGIESNTRQFGRSRPRPRTAIAGLFLAGASTAWGPGVEGTMLGGMHAASAVLERDLVRELRSGAVFADRARLSPPSAWADSLAASRGFKAHAPVRTRAAQSEVREAEVEARGSAREQSPEAI